MINWPLCGVIPNINTVSCHRFIIIIISDILQMITCYHRSQQSITNHFEFMETLCHIRCVQFTDVHSSILQSYISDQENIHLKKMYFKIQNIWNNTLENYLSSLFMYHRISLITCYSSGVGCHDSGTNLKNKIFFIWHCILFCYLTCSFVFFQTSVRFCWFWTTHVNKASSPSTFTRGVVRLWLRLGESEIN